MNKTIYSYKAKNTKQNFNDIYLQLTPEDIKTHEKIVDKIVATGVIDINRSGEYSIDIESSEAISIYMNNNIVGYFVQVSIQ